MHDIPRKLQVPVDAYPKEVVDYASVPFTMQDNAYQCRFMVRAHQSMKSSTLMVPLWLLSATWNMESASSSV